MKQLIIHILLLVNTITVLKAQEGFSSKGAFKIHNNYNGQGILIHHNYLIDGVVQTQNTTNPNKIFFGETSTWKRVNTTSYVDGYIKSKVKTNFLFPIGNNGIYKPLGLTVSENANVSYQRREPMNFSWIDSVTIKQISTKEYWNVSSVGNSLITLIYDKETCGLLDANMTYERLTIAGWDGYKWIRIPSVIDPFMIDKESSVLQTSTQPSNENEGSITSTVVVPLIYFSAFTLALTTDELNNFKQKSSKKEKEAVATTTPTKTVVESPKSKKEKEDRAAKFSDQIVLSENRNKDYKLFNKIHFAFNKSELSMYSTNILHRVVRELQELKGDYRLKLVGHTDFFGSNNYNYTLGLRRAETINQFLLTQGITNVSVEVLSEGEEGANVDCQDCKASELIANRRVDIYIIQQKK